MSRAGAHPVLEVLCFDQIGAALDWANKATGWRSDRLAHEVLLPRATPRARMCRFVYIPRERPHAELNKWAAAKEDRDKSNLEKRCPQRVLWPAARLEVDPIRAEIASLLCVV